MGGAFCRDSFASSLVDLRGGERGRSARARSMRAHVVGPSLSPASFGSGERRFPTLRLNLVPV
jgi:hypothetical protein